MKLKRLFTLGCIGIVLCINFSSLAQNYQPTSLNKGAFEAVASLTQDYDQDRDLDIIVTRWNPAGIYVLENNATKQFPATPIITEDLTFFIADIDMADFDRDGDLDLVFPEKGNLDEDVSWYENINGKLYRHHLYGQFKGARTLKFGDIDNDGDMDFLLTVSRNIVPEDEILYFENIGNHKFVNWRLHDNLENAADVELADIDGDGDLDAFVSAEEANDLVWLRNDGLPYNWVTDTIDGNTNAPIGLAAGDIDFDGDVDVALCSSNDAKVFWYENNGGGNFSKKVIDANFPNPLDIEMGDLDKDGDMDFAVAGKGKDAENIIGIYLSNNDGTFQRLNFNGPEAWSIEIGDWNNDSFLDVLVGFRSNPTNEGTDVAALINNQAGGFEIKELLRVNQRTTAIKLADLDKDSDLDLIVGHDYRFGSANLVQAILNQNGEVQKVVDLVNSSRGTVLGIDVADIDNDGIVEILYSDHDRDELILLSDLCQARPTINLGEDIGIGAHQQITIESNAEGTKLVFEWSNGAKTPSIVVTEADTYSLTVTDENGCAASDEIIVNDLCLGVPMLDLGEDLVLNQNDSIELNPIVTEEDLTYLWSTGAISTTITVTKAGVYSLTITNQNGCEAIDKVNVTVDMPSATKEEIPNDLITITPNPSIDYISIVLSNSIEKPMTISLLEMSGKIIEEKYLDKSEPSSLIMNISNLPSSIYMIKFENRKAVGFKKIVKK